MSSMPTAFKPINDFSLWLWAQRHCVSCVHFIEEPDSSGMRFCSLNIIRKSLVHKIDDVDYPSELIWKDGFPICTAEEVDS